MEEPYKLFQADHSGNINFFLGRIRKMSSGVDVSNEERLYVASVLAHFASTSRHSADYLAVLPDLGRFLEVFVFGNNFSADSEISALAGAQILVLAGFFRDQMRYRHNVRWFDVLGSNFYETASRSSGKPGEQWLFHEMSTKFPVWTRICRDLSRQTRDARYVLRLPPGPQP